jgi:hypothetical protein
MSARIISFINDTADQQIKLNELKDTDLSDIEVKAELSGWGLLHLKLQVMIYGQLVLPDSHLFNNFFLHHLADDEYSAFALVALRRARLTTSPVLVRALGF